MDYFFSNFFALSKIERLRKYWLENLEVQPAAWPAQNTHLYQKYEFWELSGAPL